MEKDVLEQLYVKKMVLEARMRELDFLDYNLRDNDDLNTEKRQVEKEYNEIVQEINKRS